MPLPSNPDLQWPPVELKQITPYMVRWSAWYSNDLAQLQAAYGGGIQADATGFFASDQGGFKAAVGRTLQRWFVAQRIIGGLPNTKLPIPIAAEMCQASADLLFSDPITVKVVAADGDGDEAGGVDDKTTTAGPTQERLNKLLDDAFHSTLAEAAEVGAALGGVYLRVTWDGSVTPDGPFTTVKDADTALPEFKWGKLQAVTFWAVLTRDGERVWRHLERHELDPVTGNGIIRHALYRGTEDRIGVRRPLTEQPATAALQEEIDTRSPGLAVQYIPNQTPNRLWRTDILGRNLGRSDLDGVEHLLDQLAETMSDWMRARRVARARIMLSKELLKNAGPGNGQVAQLDQEVYQTVQTPGKDIADAPLSSQVQVLQPTYDPAGYKMTADALIEQILQMAGYSMQTFGVNPEHSTERTATEIEQKERRSLMTRARKIREWTPPLREHLKKLLLVDNSFFSATNRFDDLDIEFSDGVQESQIKLGQFVQALYGSESASTHERVSVLHPDWDEEQVAAEVELIKSEFAAGVPMGMIPPDFGPVDQAEVTGGGTAA